MALATLTQVPLPAHEPQPDLPPCTHQIEPCNSLSPLARRRPLRKISRINSPNDAVRLVFHDRALAIMTICCQTGALARSFLLEGVPMAEHLSRIDKFDVPATSREASSRSWRRRLTPRSIERGPSGLRIGEGVGSRPIQHRDLRGVGKRSCLGRSGGRRLAKKRPGSIRRLLPAGSTSRLIWLTMCLDFRLKLRWRLGKGGVRLSPSFRLRGCGAPERAGGR